MPNLIRSLNTSNTYISRSQALRGEALAHCFVSSLACLIHIVLCNRRSQALQGEALAHRIGFERPRAPMAERLAAVIGPEADGDATNGADATLRLSLSEARRLPPTVLMSSCADTIVPW